MSTSEKSPKTITIPSSIYHAQIGASAKFFNAHVQGKEFEAVTKSPDGAYLYFYVEGEQYGVHIPDLMSDQEYQTKKALAQVEWTEGKEVKEAA